MQFNSTKTLLRQPATARTRLIHQQARIQQRNAQNNTAGIRAMKTARATPIPDLGGVVWGLPSVPADHARISTHVIHGTPPSVSEIVPLSLENLQPANLTKPALGEFLQAQLKTRAAAQKAVNAVVLSAPYLPSQVDVITDLAAKNDLITCCFISTSNLHTLLLRQPVLGWDRSTADQSNKAGTGSSSNTGFPPEAAALFKQLLQTTFQGLQPLPEQRLAAARSIEQSLNKQLRLWHPPTWTEIINQKLLSRKAQGSGILVIRSLMGTPGLEAARKLVESKPGLYWVEREVEAEQRHPEEAAGVSSSRRRPGRSGSASPTALEDGACRKSAGPNGKELLLAISAFELPAEISDHLDNLPAEMYTDYVAGSPAADSAVQQQVAQHTDKGLVPSQLAKLLQAFTFTKIAQKAE